LQYIGVSLKTCAGTAAPTQHAHRPPGTAAAPCARRRGGSQRRAEGRSEHRGAGEATEGEGGDGETECAATGPTFLKRQCVVDLYG